MPARRREPGPQPRAGADREQPRGGPNEDQYEGIFYQPNVNQGQHEPMPASREDDLWQEAVRRNEEHAHRAERPDSPARRGRAVRRLAPGGPEPGPHEPGSQVAAAEGDEGTAGKVRRVAQAPPGRPDGEVNPGR